MEIFPINADLSVPKKVKFGIDPTHSRLHLGHFVPLRLVRKMQEQGYHITIVLGTFTAQLGDPTGRESTRPIISADNAEINAGKILGQINNFLLPGFDVFKNATIHNNTLLPQFMAVAAEFTTSQMLARNNFKLRQETNQPIGLHELLVPLLQGLDSVFLDTEIEIGGEDQLFNFQVARKLQENRGLKQQACIMLPIINGVDGKKMSKSADNCIFLDEIPEEIFGKVMRISDELMMEWLPLLSDTIEIPTHPMEIKKTLAFDIVKQIHSLQIAKNCLNNATGVEFRMAHSSSAFFSLVKTSSRLELQK